MRIILTVFAIFILASCGQAKDQATAQNHEGFRSIKANTVQTDTGKDSGEQIVHKESVLSLESVAVIQGDGIKWSIGKKIDEVISSRKNCRIETNLFGGSFGPIDGYSDGNLIIGWNNRNRIVYLEIISNNVATIDGISLGLYKKDVIKKMGLSYMEKENSLRYQNNEYEVRGILFVFSHEETVTRIILFTYV